MKIPLPRFPTMPAGLSVSLRWLALMLAALWLARLAFLVAFVPADATPPASELAQAFWVGARFDLRLALLLAAPPALLTLVPWLGARLGPARLTAPWAALLTLAMALVLLLYIFDAGYYLYLRTRLDSGAITLVRDTGTAASMVWQTYPVLRLTAGWLVLCALFAWLAWSAARRSLRAAAPPARHAWLWIVPVLVLGTLGLLGKFSLYPLRWSDAYVFAHPYSTAVALNPVLNVLDTYRYAKRVDRTDAARSHYERIARFLGVEHPDAAHLDYRRVARPRAGAIPGEPNIVLVLLESFSSYRSSLSGNALDPTPHLARLAKDGILFTRMFTAHPGTARGVFATLTGIPDVSLVDTASRDPNAVEQHSIVNAFAGYDKLYFIGGSTTWANVRGFLSRSIDGIRIFEEGDFQSKAVDVWGISDCDLFREANARLRAGARPFFAVIQTADNHRPYTIPATETGFRRTQVAETELRRHGFEDLPQLEGFRFMDYCVGQFIEAARREPYFRNTVFAFIGDHGITGDAGAHMPASWTHLRLTTGHTPFVLYAPGLIRPQRIDRPAMQVDVLPTIAGLTSFSYLNKTLGRDLLASPAGEPAAFTIYHAEGPLLGVLDGDHYVSVRADGTQGRMNPLHDGDPARDVQASDPAKYARLRDLALGIYETAGYMLTHNRKEAHP